MHAPWSGRGARVSETPSGRPIVGSSRTLRSGSSTNTRDGWDSLWPSTWPSSGAVPHLLEECLRTIPCQATNLLASGACMHAMVPTTQGGSRSACIRAQPA